MTTAVALMTLVATLWAGAALVISVSNNADLRNVTSILGEYERDEEVRK